MKTAKVRQQRKKTNNKNTILSQAEQSKFIWRRKTCNIAYIVFHQKVYIMCALQHKQIFDLCGWRKNDHNRSQNYNSIQCGNKYCSFVAIVCCVDMTNTKWATLENTMHIIRVEYFYFIFSCILYYAKQLVLVWQMVVREMYPPTLPNAKKVVHKSNEQQNQNNNKKNRQQNYCEWRSTRAPFRVFANHMAKIE